MWRLFLAFTFAGLFGSLSRFTPNTPWNDFTYLFHKNGQEYLAFSNHFNSNIWLILAGVSFPLFLLDCFLSFSLRTETIMIGYACYLASAYLVEQFLWYQRTN